ncbi:hypothetical protein JMJ35_006681 [Cladonia borealis]|uniref:Methyltransferase domain-containing protein n=1 Tax=Cladonia borealis TaxID=184061 RepID=A0AA39R026_9LECA|nr:hypothetical protein JMJ35_006681 [Cladonia borealis]
MIQNVRRHGPAVFEGQPAVDAVLKQAWYAENVDSIPESARLLLEQYSNLEPEEVVPHVVTMMQDVALGKEIRYLVQDGVPSTQLYGFDLEPEFIELGYQLFRDRDRLQATFVSGDILAEPTTPEGQELARLQGEIDIIFASSFLHVWDWGDMIKAARSLVSMTRPCRGSMILGKQLGSLKAGQYKMPTSRGFNFRHNKESMAQFWQRVGDETGTSWKVEADLYQGHELEENRSHAWSEPDMRMIWFSAVRD